MSIGKESHPIFMHDGNIGLHSKCLKHKLNIINE